MNILLSTSPHVRHPAVLQNDFKPDQSIMYSFAPVGLLALTAVTRSHIGIEPTLYDLNRKVLDGTIPLGPDFYRAAASDLCKSQPDLLGFMTECDSYHHVLQICQEVKKIASSTTIVLGGPHASAVSRLTLERYVCVDAIVKGEGERAFPEYVESCRSNDEKSVPGVLRRTSNGNILDGGPSAIVENLDDLPIPAYDLYRPDPGEEIFLEVGRGCPFQCTFCSTAPYWNRRHRVKSPERILREAQLVVGLFGTRRVHFTHDLFTTNRAWVRDVCQTLVDAGTPVFWTCSARTDTVDDDLLSTMARAGCNAIYFGIESGSQRILKEIQKDIPIEHSLDIVRSCREHGISANAGFIAGFPTENEQSLEETFQAFTSALEAGCKPTHIFGFCPFADSTLYSKLGEMDCSGHFLDIPLGIATDEANRKLIASDKDLFGSYFRPRLKHLLTSGEGTISAIDEFSALVDATVIPSLMLAKAEGGMLALYRKWVRWIAARNDSRGAALYRRFYGSPMDFCDFLIQMMNRQSELPGYGIALTQVLQRNLSLAGAISASPATTMSNHRSFQPPNMEGAVTLGSELALGNVVARIEVDYDVSRFISAIPASEIAQPKHEPTFFIWQFAENGALRIVKVDPFVFHAIGHLEVNPMTAAELIGKWIEFPANALPDFQLALSSLSEASEVGLVQIKGL